MSVTSHDVAQLAGVSQPTVSRALRDDPRVSEATKDRVRRAASRLGYVPSDVGRALSSGRTRRIGLLLTDLENQFYPHIIAPAFHQLESRGYQLMLQTEAADNEVVAERLISNGLDGVLLATSTIDSVVPHRLRDRGLPFVYFNRTSAAVSADSAVVDPALGMSEAAKALFELGHRRIAAILGPANTSTAVNRELALREALAHYGISIPARYVHRGAFETSTGQVGTERFLAMPEPPTAIVCGNDVVAFGALNAARVAGADVPGDVSIIGFDDLPSASWPIIRLTTIAYDLDAMVRKAADLLVGRIEKPNQAPEECSFPSRLLMRDTLGSVN
ncbi:LacI family DNA-binding transcriptional regulator [Paenarthrobacter sp. OM7]|uniref:LacI family DNA-binding transcriptional regulator n=1 Tax=Paenarthrobacter sp. AMU7 TaxID=3162492 RepID=A0AB39YPC7_9MICC|nr:LacI family DNA-binding transcriptional regulator [Paenarthrobacter sp. OM7]WGM20497.1 LacI family DNA-binding transcriptional regulator [Paenarthrobacter sp. OM7]